MNDEEVPYYGGLISVADYCPFWDVSGTHVVHVFYLLPFWFTSRDGFTNAIAVLLLYLQGQCWKVLWHSSNSIQFSALLKDYTLLPWQTCSVELIPTTWEAFSHVAVNATSIHTQLSTTVCSQTFIHTSEWTGASPSAQSLTWQHQIWTGVLDWKCDALVITFHFVWEAVFVMLVAVFLLLHVSPEIYLKRL